jgi:predicted flap endonuclease-1-like 5' DNA nuclease
MSFPESDPGSASGRAATDPVTLSAQTLASLFHAAWWCWVPWMSWLPPAGGSVAPLDPPAPVPAEEPVTALPAADPVPAAPVPSGPAVPPRPDDLTRIEGIGPRIAEKLAQAGITTYAGLALTPPERLKAVLAKAGPRFRLARPQTWPEQAALLAAGDEVAFATLTAELRGGVRT